MSNMQTIQTRIQSIQSTRQITQSMRMVSSSKVQSAQRHMQRARPFYEETIALVQGLVAAYPQSEHRYLSTREVQCAGVVVISSDRGLCGGYNINIMKKAQALLETLPDYKLITVGTQLWDRFRRNGVMVEHGFHGISEAPYFDDAAEIASILLELYDHNEIDEIYLVHTDFISMIEQVPVVARLLPFPEHPEGKPREIQCEPGESQVFDQLIPLYLSAYLFGAMTTAAVSEQSARITSMDAATHNSDEMISALTLEYNKARQAAITRELTEIVAGADALE